MGNEMSHAWQHKSVEDKEELPQEGKEKEAKLANDYEKWLHIGPNYAFSRKDGLLRSVCIVRRSV